VSQGGPPDWGQFGQQVPPDPYGRKLPDTGGFAGAGGFDPVTGQALPPGPAAYSAVDPYAAPAYPPPNYPPPGYPPPGYPGPGYPQSAYPAGYGAQGPPAYGVPPGYQMVPMYPLAPARPPKPGGAVAAAVLGYIQSGFVLIGGVFLFSGAAGFEILDTRVGGELTVVAILAVIAGGLLVAGATTLLNRKPVLLNIGAVLSLIISLYFIIRLSNFEFGVVWVPIIYAVLPILSMAMAAGREVRAWVRAGTFDAG
jgi:hypothetical protein